MKFYYENLLISTVAGHTASGKAIELVIKATIHLESWIQISQEASGQNKSSVNSDFELFKPTEIYEIDQANCFEFLH